MRNLLMALSVPSQGQINVRWQSGDLLEPLVRPRRGLREPASVAGVP